MYHISIHKKTIVNTIIFICDFRGLPKTWKGGKTAEPSLAGHQPAQAVKLLLQLRTRDRVLVPLLKHIGLITNDTVKIENFNNIFLVIEMIISSSYFYVVKRNGRKERLKQEKRESLNTQFVHQSKLKCLGK